MGLFHRDRSVPEVVRRAQVRRLVGLMTAVSDAVLEDEPANPDRGYERATALLDAALRSSTQAEVRVAVQIHNLTWP